MPFTKLRRHDKRGAIDGGVILMLALLLVVSLIGLFVNSIGNQREGWQDFATVSEGHRIANQIASEGKSGQCIDLGIRSEIDRYRNILPFRERESLLNQFGWNTNCGGWQVRLAEEEFDAIQICDLADGETLPPNARNHCDTRNRNDVVDYYQLAPLGNGTTTTDCSALETVPNSDPLRITRITELTVIREVRIGVLTKTSDDREAVPINIETEARAPLSARSAEFAISWIGVSSGDTHTVDANNSATDDFDEEVNRLHPLEVKVQGASVLDERRDWNTYGTWEFPPDREGDAACFAVVVPTGARILYQSGGSTQVCVLYLEGANGDEQCQSSTQ